MTEQLKAAAQGVTVLPDGSAFATASWPLPKEHWLFAPRGEWDNVRNDFAECPTPILTHAVRDAVVAAIRYAVRGATMCGQEMDFDPDALVQNAVYALCGPFGGAALAADAVPTEPAGAAVAHLWQHTETGRTRIVMPDQIITADANWIVVGPLVLAAPQPASEPQPAPVGVDASDAPPDLATCECGDCFTAQERGVCANCLAADLATKTPDPIPEGMALVPIEPNTAILRPYYECPPNELPQAWAAMLMVAKAQARKASEGLRKVVRTEGGEA